MFATLRIKASVLLAVVSLVGCGKSTTTLDGAANGVESGTEGLVANTARSNLCGVNMHVGYDNLPLALGKVASANTRWARVDFLWLNIEPVARGSYDWSRMDSLVSQAIAQGIQILAVVAYTPAWANGGRAMTEPPTNADDFRNFLTAAMRHYPGIKHWEIWNEPNSIYFQPSVFCPTDKIASYATLVAKAHEASVMAGTGAKVVAPSVSLDFGWNTSNFAALCGVTTDLTGDCAINYLDVNTAFVKGVLERAHVDVVSFHRYQRYPTRIAEQIKAAYKGSGAECRGLPMWLTETGWPAREYTQDQQAQKVREILTLNEQNMSWWQKTFIYELKDQSTTDNFGLLTTSWGDKKPYTEMKSFCGGC
jgi:polysaccharide biosynthesis protein PslG